RIGRGSRRSRRGLASRPQPFFDERDGGRYRALAVERRGVEGQRIVGRAKRSFGACAVAFVAAAQVGFDGGEVEILATLPHLLPAAQRARFYACGDEQLHVGFGRDDGSDVT